MKVPGNGGLAVASTHSSYKGNHEFTGQSMSCIKVWTRISKSLIIASRKHLHGANCDATVPEIPHCGNLVDKIDSGSHFPCNETLHFLQ